MEQSHTRSWSIAHRAVTIALALIWLYFGLILKIAQFAPRHQTIVAQILGETYAREIVVVIGILEIGMALWIVSGLWTQLNAAVQMIIVASMNVLEAFFALDHLLWGRANAVLAAALSRSSPPTNGSFAPARATR